MLIRKASSSTVANFPLAASAKRLDAEAWSCHPMWIYLRLRLQEVCIIMGPFVLTDMLVDFESLMKHVCVCVTYIYTQYEMFTKMKSGLLLLA